MNELEAWTTAVRQALALGATPVEEQSVVLDLARDVAHGVVRPAAPLSTYLLGLAVGRGASPVEAARLVTELARDWRSPEAD